MRSRAGTTATDKESFEKLIDGVNAMVAILTGSVRDGNEYYSDYFHSVPCQHELGRALKNNTRVVFVLETDALHGGIPLEAHRRACPQHLLPLINRSKVVEWHRIQAYQDVSLKVILQELLRDRVNEQIAPHIRANKSDDLFYLKREVVREPVHLKQAAEGSFHLYVSKYNEGASDLVSLLSKYLRSATDAEDGKSRAQGHTGVAVLSVTSDPVKMKHADHFMCYLNARTHSSGNSTSALHAELEAALEAEMHILLVHETRIEANGTTFKNIIDSTPQALQYDEVSRSKRLYKELAVVLCGSQDHARAHLNVGLHLLLSTIAHVSEASDSKGRTNTRRRRRAVVQNVVTEVMETVPQAERPSKPIPFTRQHSQMQLVPHSRSSIAATNDSDEQFFKLASEDVRDRRLGRQRSAFDLADESGDIEKERAPSRRSATRTRTSQASEDGTSNRVSSKGPPGRCTLKSILGLDSVSPRLPVPSQLPVPTALRAQSSTVHMLPSSSAEDAGRDDRQSSFKLVAEGVRDRRLGRERSAFKLTDDLEGDGRERAPSRRSSNRRISSRRSGQDETGDRRVSRAVPKLPLQKPSTAPEDQGWSNTFRSMLVPMWSSSARSRADKPKPHQEEDRVLI